MGPRGLTVEELHFREGNQSEGIDYCINVAMWEILDTDR